LFVAAVVVAVVVVVVVVATIATALKFVAICVFRFFFCIFLNGGKMREKLWPKKILFECETKFGFYFVLKLNAFFLACCCCCGCLVVVALLLTMLLLLLQLLLLFTLVTLAHTFYLIFLL